MIMKVLILCICLSVCVTAMAGCAGNSEPKPSQTPEQAEHDLGQTEYSPEPMTEQEGETVMGITAAVINGKTYYNTGSESSIDGRCGVMDGYLTVSMEESGVVLRESENTSPYGYQITGENRVDVYMSNRWVEFMTEE